MPFDEYEQAIINELAKSLIEPHLLHRAVSIIGKPIHKAFESARRSNVKALQRAAGGVQEAIIRAQLQTIRLAQNLSDPESILAACDKIGAPVGSLSQIENLPMEKKDQLADQFIGSNAVWVGVEGVVLGLATSLAALVPFAQVTLPGFITTDILLSLTLLARHVVQVATSYGYSGQQPENIPHILAAMVPEKEMTEEGYLYSKTLILHAIRDSADFLSRYSGQDLTRELISQKAPRLIKLMQYVAERLGFILTEKQLAVGVPVASAFLNGGINVTFQHFGHRTAKNYFRRLLLENKYGAERVQKAINEKVQV
ncbi:MAG: hypothetical protein D6814_09440, partial [Calditrichaeota bacterium]